MKSNTAYPTIDLYNNVKVKEISKMFTNKKCKFLYMLNTGNIALNEEHMNSILFKGHFVDNPKQIKHSNKEWILHLQKLVNGELQTFYSGRFGNFYVHVC